MRTLVARSMDSFGVAILIALAWVAAPPAAGAEKLTLACEEDDIRGGPTAPPLATKIVIETGQPASVEVKAHYGTIKLPARVVANDVATQVNAAGPGKARMPAKHEVDSCLAKEKAPPAGQPLDVWAAQTCRLRAASTPEPVAVDVTVEITILDGDVTTLVERRYAGDAGAAVERYATPSRPICKVESGK